MSSEGRHRLDGVDGAVVELTELRQLPLGPSGSGLELEVAEALVRRISWIAVVLTPLMSTPVNDGDAISALVADLDGLIRDLRFSTVGTEDGVDDPLDQARRVLHHVGARINACWAARFEAPVDPVHTDLLAEASHLVRSALISLQHGAVP